MDKVITDFLATKFYKKDFEKWRKELKKFTEKEDIANIQIAKNQLAIVKHKAGLELVEWLDNASKRAGQLSLTTHPSKFSHPDAKIDAIVANCKQANDGLLRTGNVEVVLDVVGNAASLDVDKFLRLKLSNHLTILQNLEQGTDYIKSQFNNEKFDEIRLNFLKIKKSGISNKSSDKLKQVYFPVAEDYHLLSLLTPSAIVYELKQRINDNYQPFSKQNKQAKEAIKEAVKNKQEFKANLESIWGLTAIGYGGTKPQNISVINNKNGGIAYLLCSMPPHLKQRKVQPPKADFFKTNIYLGDWLKQDFDFLHKILSGNNNIKVRTRRDQIVVSIMLKIKQEIDKVREINNGWSDSKTYDGLPKWQKVLLDDKYKNIRADREQNLDFLNNTGLEFAKWFSKIYNKLYETNLGDIEITHIESVIEDEMEVFK